jgi:hypothetical protein
MSGDDVIVTVNRPNEEPLLIVATVQGVLNDRRTVIVTVAENVKAFTAMLGNNVAVPGKRPAFQKAPNVVSQISEIVRVDLDDKWRKADLQIWHKSATPALTRRLEVHPCDFDRVKPYGALGTSDTFAESGCFIEPRALGTAHFEQPYRKALTRVSVLTDVTVTPENCFVHAPNSRSIWNNRPATLRPPCVCLATIAGLNRDPIVRTPPTTPDLATNCEIPPTTLRVV